MNVVQIPQGYVVQLSELNSEGPWGDPAGLGFRVPLERNLKWLVWDEKNPIAGVVGGYSRHYLTVFESEADAKSAIFRYNRTFGGVAGPIQEFAAEARTYELVPR